MFPRVLNSPLLGCARCLLVGFVALLFMTSATTVSAAGVSDDTGPVPVDKICVEGSIIDHNENLLKDGWIIGATPRNAQGELDTTRAISEISNNDGYFKFEELPEDPTRGLFAGDWQFQVEITQKADQEWEPVTPDLFDVSLAYGQQECIKIRFKLRRIIKVTVIKVNDEYVGQENWRIHAEPGPGNIFATAQEFLTDNTGTIVFRLSPGRWIFTESAPPGVTYTPVLPPNGMQEVDVQTPVTLYFKNRIRFKGCVEVFKHDVRPDNTQMPLSGWLIQVLRTNGSVAASGLTDLSGKVRFDGLQPGPYQVVEETRIGWKPITPTTLAVTVTGSEACEVVTFFNVQEAPQFCIEGIKIDTNGKVGIPGWKIWAEPLDPGGFQPTPLLTDGQGEYTFVLPEDDYRIPGSRYKICEEQKDGWLPHTDTCYTVVLPQEPSACVRVPTFENQQKGHVVTPKPVPGHPHCRNTHVVKPGEGLYSIGQKYGVPSRAMLKANPWVQSQKHMYVYVGQKICIP